MKLLNTVESEGKFIAMDWVDENYVVYI